MDRRHFISRLGSVAAGSSAALAALAQGAEKQVASPTPLPTISLGEHRITRLVAGSNPLNGYSYLGPHVDRQMKEYFTVDRAVEFLLACEQAGINTHQFSYTPTGNSGEIVREARQRGSQMQFFCLAKNREEIRPAIADDRPFALVHHGGVTDRMFAEGRSGEVHDFVKAVHDAGLLAGVSAHNPKCIRRAADEGWKVDFFMNCFYFLTRRIFQKAGEPAAEPEILTVGYPFYRNDPAVMTEVIRQVDQPCLAFKILAAGRRCANQEAVAEAFRFAFASIKPTDAVIVGMYPQYFDEIGANARYTRQFGEKKAG